MPPRAQRQLRQELQERKLSEPGYYGHSESSAEYDSDETFKQLPASIQAMLMRATRTLSKSELHIVSRATPNNRCDALRMIFEGKSADDALAFIIETNRRDRSHSLKTAAISPARRTGSIKMSTDTGTALTTTNDPPTRAATVERSRSKMSVDGGNRGSEASSARVSLRAASCTRPTAPSLHSEGESDPDPSSKLVTPGPFEHGGATAQFQRPTSISHNALPEHQDVVVVVVPVPAVPSGTWDSGDDTDLAYRSLSPSIRIPSPQASLCPAPVQKMDQRVVKKGDCKGEAIRSTNATAAVHRRNVNSKVEATEAVEIGTCDEYDTGAAFTKVVSSVRPQCSAWDEHFQTYIVHPNHLRRLEELEQHGAPPSSIRPGSGSVFKRSKNDERCQFSGQYTALEMSHAPPLRCNPRDSSNLGTSRPIQAQRTHKAPRIVRNQEQRQVRASPSVPCVPALKGIKGARGKEDVFTRLYSSCTSSWTPRPTTAGWNTARSGVTGRTTPLRETRMAHSSLSYGNRTPRRVGDTFSRNLSCVSPHHFMRTRSRYQSCSTTHQQNQGTPTRALSSRRGATTVSPLSRSFSTTRHFQQTATRANNPQLNQRNAYMQGWTACRQPCSARFEHMVVSNSPNNKRKIF